MRKSFLFNAILIACICICIFYCLYIHIQFKKIAVVDIYKVLNEFKLKKELEAEQAKNLSYINNKVDSMNALISAAQNKQTTQIERERLSRDFYNLQLAAKQAYEKSNQEISEKVWKRLNPLIDDFGKENNYELIVGGNGMGTILFANQSRNITNSVIQYINRKYEVGN